ncbi:hypothetical protein VE03_05295 [Pseudogymnoascus sp. 23342-1-I1]|nr:hypothetical protein VE03_05295 [Pseudogymnoascus sp. 23342-1-I1]
MHSFEPSEDPLAKWYILKHVFLGESIKADILFILDCCHSGGSIQPPKSKAKNVVDVIAACSAKAKTPHKLEEDRAAFLADDIEDERDTYPQWFPLRYDGRNPRNIEFSGIGVKKTKLEAPRALLLAEHSPSLANIDIEAKIKEFKRRQASLPKRPISTQPATMGNYIPKEDETQRQSRNWFKRYEDLEHTHMVGRSGYETSNICKVSIIGSGIDLEHIQLRFRTELIGNLLDFSESNGDCHDEVGFGTTCAILVSRLAHCRIFIAKVAKGEKWSVNECKVDIIIFPFGMKHLDPELDNVISMAHSRNVVCLAASGNGGANEKLPFPAGIPGVLAINSTDGYGNPAPFNPSPRMGRKNFSTLGQGIHVRVKGKGDHLDKDIQNGSSFAVSVAGGILAAMFMFASDVLMLEERDLKDLRTPKGAEKLFDLMSCKRGDYDYVAPWILIEEMDPVDSLEEHNALIKAKIVTALRDK